MRIEKNQRRVYYFLVGLGNKERVEKLWDGEDYLEGLDKYKRAQGEGKSVQLNKVEFVSTDDKIYSSVEVMFQEKRKVLLDKIWLFGDAEFLEMNRVSVESRKE